MYRSNTRQCTTGYCYFLSVITGAVIQQQNPLASGKDE